MFVAYCRALRSTVVPLQFCNAKINPTEFIEVKVTCLRWLSVGHLRRYNLAFDICMLAFIINTHYITELVISMQRGDGVKWLQIRTQDVTFQRNIIMEESRFVAGRRGFRFTW